MRRDGITESARGRWTHPEDYVTALARKRTHRRALRGSKRERTEPESPRLLMSTLPFGALLIFLGALMVMIMVAAFPGSQPQPKPPQVAQQEIGVAPKGWFQEAQKEFHR